MVFREALVSVGLFASTGCYRRLWRSCRRLKLKSPAAAWARERLWPAAELQREQLRAAGEQGAGSS